MQKIACIIIFIILLILIIGLCLQLLFEKVLFFPIKELIWKPNEPYQDVYFDSKSGNLLHGWYFSLFPGAKTVLFNHGNSGNISYRSTVLQICLHQKLNILTYDYSGFGKSTGSPSIANIMQDGLAAYDYLTTVRGINENNIVVWGESMGGATAIYVASKRKPSLLILIATFSDLVDCISFNPTANKFCGKHGVALLVKSLFSFFEYDKVSSKIRISEIECPVAILHSKEDKLIDYRNAEILFASIFHSNKILIPVKGNHATPILDSKDLERLFNFCNFDRQYLFSDTNRGQTQKILRKVAGHSSEDSLIEFNSEKIFSVSEKNLSTCSYFSFQ